MHAQFVRQAKQHIAGEAGAGAGMRGSRIFSSSASFSPGIMGAASTAVGMPAWLRAAIAARRRSAVAARGSMQRASFASSVVTERYTRTSPRDGHALQNVHIAQHAGRFGDDADRVAEAFQHLQHGAGQFQGAVDRLIRVGIGAERHRRDADDHEKRHVRQSARRRSEDRIDDGRNNHDAANQAIPNEPEPDPVPFGFVEVVPAAPQVANRDDEPDTGQQRVQRGVFPNGSARRLERLDVVRLSVHGVGYERALRNRETEDDITKPFETAGEPSLARRQGRGKVREVRFDTDR